MGARLSAWKGKLLYKAGRLRLINSVLTSIPIYYLTVFRLQKCAVKKIDSRRGVSYGRDLTYANEGHCLVKWSKVMKPKSFGGLGVLDLDLFSQAQIEMVVV